LKKVIQFETITWDFFACLPKGFRLNAHCGAKEAFAERFMIMYISHSLRKKSSLNTHSGLDKTETLQKCSPIV